jgi:hypothetical protein
MRPTGCTKKSRPINWLSRRAGWKETQVHQIEGGDRGPIGTHDPSLRERILARIAAIHTGDET